MRIVVQRVSRATVRAEGRELGSIGRGAVVLVGVAPRDDVDIADRMAAKLVALRYFTDPGGRTNLALADISGSLLVVSQFTLLADVRHGRRPGFTTAAAPEVAEPMVDRFVESLRSAGATVETGAFGAVIEVELVNDGPFTLVVDSRESLGA